MELGERLQELRADRRHGASFLARRAVEALVEVAEPPAATREELLERVTSAARQLAAARPASPPSRARSGDCSQRPTPRRTSLPPSSAA
jgi:hypothetical protein